MATIIGQTNLTAIECYKCGILFAVPDNFNREQLRLCEKGGFYCPNGHQQVYCGKSYDTILKEKEKQISNLQSECTTLSECCINAQEKAKLNDYRARAYKGQIKKLQRSGGK